MRALPSIAVILAFVIVPGVTVPGGGRSAVAGEPLPQSPTAEAARTVSGRTIEPAGVMLREPAGGMPREPAAGMPREPAAGMQYPLGVAVAADGAVLVADRLLPGLWRIQDGRLDVLAAGTRRFRTPLNAVRAVAVAPDGTVFAGDSATREVYRIAADGPPVGLTGGGIGIPVDIAIDSAGRLFVSDLETQRVWRIDPAGGEPVEVAEVAAPRGLFIDGRDRLWVVAASGAEPLLRIGGDGAVEPVVRSQAFEFPHDVVVDAAGVAYVSDNYARCIWRVPVDGEPQRWAEGPPLMGPVGLAIRGERVLVADPRARQVFALDAEGRPTPLGPPPGPP